MSDDKSDLEVTLVTSAAICRYSLVESLGHLAGNSSPEWMSHCKMSDRHEMELDSIYGLFGRNLT